MKNLAKFRNPEEFAKGFNAGRLVKIMTGRHRRLRNRLRMRPAVQICRRGARLRSVSVRSGGVH